MLRSAIGISLILFSSPYLAGGSGHSAETVTNIKDNSRILTMEEPLGVASPEIHKHLFQTYTQAQATPSYYGGYYQNYRPSRQLLSSLTPTNILALGTNSNYGYNDYTPETSEMLQAAGGGWTTRYNTDYSGAKGEHDHYGIKEDNAFVNFSAVGLLGFLALLSLIQNVLRQISSSTTASPSGRRKRSSGDDNIDSQELDRVTNMIMPLLTAAAHARDGLIPYQCTHRKICDANQRLTRELGVQGRSVALIITDAVSVFLTKDLADPSLKQAEMKSMFLAGKNGRVDDGNCGLLYRNCRQLSQLPVYTIPVALLENSGGIDPNY